MKKIKEILKKDYIVLLLSMYLVPPVFLISISLCTIFAEWPDKNSYQSRIESFEEKRSLAVEQIDIDYYNWCIKDAEVEWENQLSSLESSYGLLEVEIYWLILGIVPICLIILFDYIKKA